MGMEEVLYKTFSRCDIDQWKHLINPPNEKNETLSDSMVSMMKVKKARREGYNKPYEQVCTQVFL
jgi:hypothetical protein